MKQQHIWVLGGLVAWWFSFAVQAAERDAAAAEKAALGDDQEGKAYVPQRPKNLPDLTKGEKIPLPKDGAPITWNVGPSGIIGIKNGGFGGDQVQVVAVLPGSPAEGKVLPGDVILGVGGRDFVAGGHLGVTIGNAIIKAEEEAGKGLLELHLWRDLNWARRAAGKDIAGVNVDELFKQAEDTSALYEWEGEKQRKSMVEDISGSEFPVMGSHTNLTLQLKVMGTYSDTSPWDCPVAARIREDAWKVIEAAFKPNKQGRTTATWRDAIGLVASGKPEHRELVRQWVRAQKLCRDIKEKVEPVQGGGYLSWHYGFAPLDMAIYYDATGDDYVLPEIRRKAIEVAMGQSGGGSWGHTFSFPVHNGGQLHGRNPGYGALNAAGSRCFFLLTLAKKAGIKDPEIDAAIVRASRFFGTYVDKGCIPYGDHGPYPSDDSNGKNFGATYAFYVLGDAYKAKYFGMTSAHAAFTPRGGHGSPVLWQYTPLSSHVTGPRGVQAAMRNMRWFYTVARRHDGSFVIQSEQEGVGAYGYTGISPTALYAMYHSAPLKQLIITGKDANTNCWFNDQELDQLLGSARSQMNDPVLLERSGKPWNERATDELVGWVGHFYPNVRRAVAAELGKRFKAGESAIAPKLVALLDSPEARVRQGACLALVACGGDPLVGAMTKLVKLLDDSAEIVRMGAVAAIAAAAKPGDAQTEPLLLKAAVTDYPGMSTDLANVSTVVRDLFFSGKTVVAQAVGSKLITEPFQAGYDKELVRAALERIVTMDPGGVVPGWWDKETVVELAGPIVFVAEELQLMDKMGMGARLDAGRAVLKKYGYRELAEAEMVNLKKRKNLERSVRRSVQFTMGGAYDLGNPLKIQEQPSLYRAYLPALKEVLQDDPLTVMIARTPDYKIAKAPLVDVIEKIEAAKDTTELPSLGKVAMQAFEKELAQQAGPEAVVSYCRAVLRDPRRKDFFRQMAAMSRLANVLRGEAIGDIAPYLGANQWRVREHAHALAVELAKAGASGKLIERLSTAGGANAAEILLVLKDAGAKTALEPARAALKHKDGVVRKAALQTVMALGGERMLPEVMAFLANASESVDLWGCELALLQGRDDAALARRVRDEAIILLPEATPVQRRALAYVLGQLGGPESLAVLKQAFQAAKEDADRLGIAEGLSYSPDRAVDQLLLELAKAGGKDLDAVLAVAFRRMVGPNGVGDVTDTQRLDLAIPLLTLKPEDRLIRYLGNVHTGRCIQFLAEYMKQGKAALISESIISAAEGMEKPAEAEAKVAAEGLAQVIEYIEVNYLRGGIKAHMSVEDNYFGWNEKQERAGKAMLKIHKPAAAPVPQFNDRDLDI